MALYLGNDEVSQRISLANVKGTNLPEITEETSGMFLSNDGENIAWSEVETTVDTVLNGWSLLDYKFSDHILEDESWTRSDSFDWKDGTVYTSAYEHLLADYNSGEEKYDYRASNINVIGELTNEKGVLSGFSASNYASMNTLTSFNNSVGSNPWEMVYKFNINELPSEGTVQSLIGGNGGTYIIDLLFNPNGTLRLALSSNGSSYDIFESSSSYAFDANKDYWVKLQFTGTQYILSYSENGEEYTSDLTIESNAVLEPTDDLIYLGCRGNLGNPFVGSIDLNECYIKINGLEWWEGTDAIKYRLSSDGHKVCDYVQENAIQNVYDLNGVAWYYIIDTVNSKFKLPRSKWNFVGLRNEVGAFVDESLPNITGDIKIGLLNSASDGNGALKKGDASTNMMGSGSYNGFDLELDASLSSSAYQDNAPVQQRATEMYLYFYVGDVVRNTSIINITQFGDRMIEVENTVANVESTVEQHIEEVNTTVANIESSVGDKLDTTQITNCITEIPQNIKLELVDGALTLKAGSKVYVPNGFEADGTTPKFDEVVLENDFNVSNGGASGNKLAFWRSEAKSWAGIRKDLCYSSATEPETGKYQIWYDITNNSIYRDFEFTGEWIRDDKISLPFASFTTGNESVISSIDQVFNGFGYIGSTIFALPGVKALGPNGRNEDGSLRNTENNVTSVITRDFKDFNGDFALWLINGRFGAQIKSYIIYDEEKNYNKQINDGAYISSAIVLNFSKKSNENISSFQPKLPFKVVDQNDMETKANIDLSNILANIDYVVESKLPTDDDQTWYRVYKSGWVEQGGLSDMIPANGGLDIVFPKEMANKLYSVSLTNSDYNIPQLPGTNRMTTKMNVDYQSASYEGKVIWEVKGQGA